MIQISAWGLPDVAEIARLAEPHFAARRVGCDISGAAALVREALRRYEVIPVRTDNVIGLAVFGMSFGGVRPIVEEQFVFSLKPAPWEVMAIYRYFLNEAERRGAVEFRFGQSTGAEIEIVARRLKARPAAFVVETGGQKCAAAAA